jgi:hypothetical protein
MFVSVIKLFQNCEGICNPPENDQKVHDLVACAENIEPFGEPLLRKLQREMALAVLWTSLAVSAHI